MPAQPDDEPVVVALDTATESYALGRGARRVVALLAGGAVLAAVLALVLRGGGETERRARGAPAPPSSVAFPLAPARPLGACEAAPPEAGREPPIAGVALLARSPLGGDQLPFTAAALPIARFDPEAVRRVERRRTVVHVVPSAGVAAGGDCETDGGPGVCLVADAQEFACFTVAELRAGRALAVTSDATVVGLLPDGIDRMTLAANGPAVTAAVVDNVVELDFHDAAGVHALAVFHRPGGCRRGVAPALLDRVALLRELPRPGRRLPDAAHDALAQWSWWLDTVVEDGARLWDREEDLDFWAVPVVPSGEPPCAPATRVCVVAAVRDGGAGAHCVVGAGDGADWIVVGAGRGRSLIYGVVPDGVTGARAASRGRTVHVPARKNVIGGVLPMRWDDVRVRLVRGHNSAAPDQ